MLQAAIAFSLASEETGGLWSGFKPLCFNEQCVMDMAVICNAIGVCYK